MNRLLFFSKELPVPHRRFRQYYHAADPSARLALVGAALIQWIILFFAPGPSPRSVWYLALVACLLTGVAATGKIPARYASWFTAGTYTTLLAGFLLFNLTTGSCEARAMGIVAAVIVMMLGCTLRIPKYVFHLINLAAGMVIAIIVNGHAHEDQLFALYMVAFGITVLTTWALEKTARDGYTALVLLEEERQHLKALKEKLEKSDTLKSKLLTIVAHDLKGPTKNTAAMLQLLNAGDLSKDEFNEQIKKLEMHMQGNLLLLENLLRWSMTKIDKRQQLIETDLRLVVQECVDLMMEAAARKENRVINAIPPVRIVTDPEIVKMIIRNLLSNAIKFTHRGTITCSYDATDWHHRITVRDTGVGMPGEKVQQLFDWAQRTSTRGTHDEKGAGIGLLISGEFLESLDGSLQIDTHPGVGTAVSIGLKRVP
jgi:signal transduction histidine kinase